MKNQKGQSIAEFALVGGIVLVIVIVIAALAGQSMGNNAAGTAQFLDQITFKPSNHAIETHIEAADIMSCLNKKGPYQVWRDKADKNTFYALCNLDNGKWGLAVCTATGANKTAFSPEDGSRDSIFKYVMKRGTRFLMGLPAGCK